MQYVTKGTAVKLPCGVGAASKTKHAEVMMKSPLSALTHHGYKSMLSADIGTGGACSPFCGECGLNGPCNGCQYCVGHAD